MNIIVNRGDLVGSRSGATAQAEHVLQRVGGRLIALLAWGAWAVAEKVGNGNYGITRPSSLQPENSKLWVVLTSGNGKEN